MLPLIPIGAAILSAAVLIKNKLKSNAKKASHSKLIDYVKSLNIPVDDNGNFNPDALLPDGKPILFDVMFNTELFTALLDLGANPNICNADGIPAIIYAVTHRPYSEQVNTISTLLKYGANPNAMDSEGKTAIFHAEFYTILEQLKAAGADLNAVDCTGKTALFDAIIRRNSPNAVSLAALGADVNIRDSDGKTILFYITGTEFFETIKYMQRYGLDIDAVDNQGHKFEYYDSYLRYLEEIGNSPKTQNLYNAVDSNNISEVRRWLAKGANPNIWDKDVKDWSMIHLAVFKKNPHMIEVLALGGADINAQRDGIPPLSKAIYDNNYDCFKMLLELGADTELSKNAVTFSGTNEMKELFKKYTK